MISQNPNPFHLPGQAGPALPLEGVGWLRQSANAICLVLQQLDPLDHAAQCRRNAERNSLQGFRPNRKSCKGHLHIPTSTKISCRTIDAEVRTSSIFVSNLNLTHLEIKRNLIRG